MAASRRWRPAAIDLSRVRPTAQELRSAAWWVERALEQAVTIEPPEVRGRACWEVGVAAFDCGRFDLVRRVMTMGELTDQDQGTLGYRLVEAYATADDLGRLLEVAGALRVSGYERRHAVERAAGLLAGRGDLAAAERLIDEQLRAGDRLAPYLTLADRAAATGDLPRAWALAGKAAREENSSGAPAGYLMYLGAAARAGRAGEVERAEAAALAVGAKWPDGMRGTLRLDVADALRAAGRADRARRHEDEARALGVVRDPAAGRPPAWLEVDDLAASGRIDEADRKAGAITDPYDRALALARLAGRPAEGGAARDRSIAAARAARDAMRLALTETPGPDRSAADLAEAVATALAAAGDPAGAVAACAELSADAGRWRALRGVAGARSAAGDVALARAAVAAADGGSGADGPTRDGLRFALVLALLKGPAEPEGGADERPARAAEAAGGIGDPALRATALLAVARVRARAGDASGAGAVLAAANQAMTRVAGDHDRERVACGVAEVEALSLRVDRVWASARAAPTTARRVGLLLAGARGLLGRVTDAGPGGESVPGH